MPRKLIELDEQDRQFLTELHQMETALVRCYEGLADESGIDRNYLSPVFESHSDYEKALARAYPNARTGYGYGITHYKERIQRWNESADKDNLTREDLIRILKHR